MSEKEAKKQRSKEAKKVKDAVAAIKVLSNPARFTMLRVLLSVGEKGQEMCVKEIAEAVGISQSAASHQLARLEDKGLVCSSRMGQMICYQICDSPRMRVIAKIIKQFD
jgi:DNA-binding transcriptional ArsR family regulator